jgi:predicted enzyme related to lactoylglutathione lyase
MSSAAQPMSDGRKPEPGGWNRFVVQVKDLRSVVSGMKEKNINFRNEIFSGPGGFQILCEDPSGNVIELFQQK